MAQHRRRSVAADEARRVLDASSCSNSDSSNDDSSDSEGGQVPHIDIAATALAQLVTEPDPDALVRLRARIARAITRLSMLRPELHRLQRQADCAKLQLFANKLTTAEDGDIPRELLANAAAASRGAASTRRRARKATAALCSKLRTALAEKRELPQLTADLVRATGRANGLADARRKALHDTKRQCALARRALHAEAGAEGATSPFTSDDCMSRVAELGHDAGSSVDDDHDLGKLDEDQRELDDLARLAITREEAELLGRLRALTNQIDAVRTDRERVQTETNVARAREAAVRAWRREMLTRVGTTQSRGGGDNSVAGGETPAELASSAAAAALSGWRQNSGAHLDAMPPRLRSCIAQECERLPPPPVPSWAPARLQRHACLDAASNTPPSLAQQAHDASASAVSQCADLQPRSGQQLQNLRDGDQSPPPNLCNWTVEVKAKVPTGPVTLTAQAAADVATGKTAFAEYSICGW